MKNPIKQLFQCILTWNQLRKYSGLFRLRDALMQMHRVLLPARLNDRSAGFGLKQHLVVSGKKSHDSSAVKIHCSPLKLDFLWNGNLDNNLFFMAEQEFSVANPHCYTTPPIQIEGMRQIIDVGACEGLFAFRMAKNNEPLKVHCFEPSQIMSSLIQEGAVFNEVSESVFVHREALLDQPGYVKFKASESPDAGMVVPCTANDVEAISSNSLDHFCKETGLVLTQNDLIKIDAEGSDFDVLKGARHVIETCRPQIAVTTYHKDDHAESIYRWLKDLDLGYNFRLKGFSFWTSKPRPVLLQASTLLKK
jgi:FkbM family methyltransferase